MPVQQMSAGGYILKIRNANGDRVVTAEDATINVISARVDTRYVWVKVEVDQESDNISLVTYQVRTKSSWLVAGRNPDVRLAAVLAEDTFRNLVAQENPQP